jgi:co-chaperonin GroES (HSP10)
MSRIESLKPMNRYVTIVPHFDDKKTDTGVLLPDDFKQEESRFIKATVVDIATDCKEDLKRMRRSSKTSVTAVVDRTMIETVEVANRKHYVVLENYIVGIYRRPDED